MTKLTNKQLLETILKKVDSNNRNLKEQIKTVQNLTDEQSEEIAKINQQLGELKKDNAVIMETLQLILTNMMLDKVETVRDTEQ